MGISLNPKFSKKIVIFFIIFFSFVFWALAHFDGKKIAAGPSFMEEPLKVDKFDNPVPQSFWIERKYHRQDKKKWNTLSFKQIDDKQAPK